MFFTRFNSSSATPLSSYTVPKDRTISPPKKFRIEYNAGTKTFEEFKMFIGNKCNNQVLNATLYMREATESGSPPLNWKVWLV
jgi:hypothetical protein